MNTLGQAENSEAQPKQRLRLNFPLLAKPVVQRQPVTGSYTSAWVLLTAIPHGVFVQPSAPRG
jgi:hypothetical protein